MANEKEERFVSALAKSLLENEDTISLLKQSQAVEYDVKRLLLRAVCVSDTAGTVRLRVCCHVCVGGRVTSE